MKLNKPLRTIVIEDEDSVRKILINALNEATNFQVIAEANSIDKAYQVIQRNVHDVIFLDIKIIGGDAFQLLRQLQKNNIPIAPTIINTGYREFELAQRTFNEFGDIVVHLLKKPFWNNWDEKEGIILNKLLKFRKQKKLDVFLNANLITLKAGRKGLILRAKDIIYIQTKPAKKGYTEIVLEKKIEEINQSLKNIALHLPAQFVFINRKTIINISWISYLYMDKAEVYLKNGESFLVGKIFMDNLKDWFIS